MWRTALCVFSPPTSHYPFPLPARTVILLQAKHEVALGGGVSRKNSALVRRDQARHLRPNHTVLQLLRPCSVSTSRASKHSRPGATF